MKQPLLLFQLFFVLLWSNGAIVIVLGLRYTDPFTFLFYRLTLAALIMFFIALVTKAPWPKDWATFKKIALFFL